MKAAEEREMDAHWMRQAVAAAHDARERGEVPIGTCIVGDETMLAVAGNRTHHRSGSDRTCGDRRASRSGPQGRQLPTHGCGCLFHDRTLRDVRRRLDTSES